LIHENERLRQTQYVNKQRTLIFATRGINQRMRHLMQDLRDLLPHSKAEAKFEDKRALTDINEICCEHNCNNVIFFEARRHTDLYLWMGHVPNGPSIKFFVSNVHTMAELRLTGNCLKGSRPILIFDKSFESNIQYKIMKELITQIFGTPRGHPKSKPFVDHCFVFMLADHKIWFRNFQIVYDADPNTKTANDPNNVILVEIGPRFVLHPVRIQRGSFQGTTIYQDEYFLNPNAKRRAEKRQKQLLSSIKVLNEHNENKNKDKNTYLNKMIQKIKKSERKKYNKVDNDPLSLDCVFDEGVNFNQNTMNVDDKNVENFLE